MAQMAADKSLVKISNCVSASPSAFICAICERSNAYTSSIVESRARGTSVGLSVQPNHHVSIHFIRCGPVDVKVVARSSRESGTTYIKIGDEHGSPTETAITKEEFMAHTATIREERICIQDRSALVEIQRRGERELGELAKLHDRFAKVCRDHAKRADLFAGFTNLNEGYWI